MSDPITVYMSSAESKRREITVGELKHALAFFPDAASVSVYDGESAGLNIAADSGDGWIGTRTHHDGSLDIHQIVPVQPDASHEEVGKSVAKTISEAFRNLER